MMSYGSMLMNTSAGMLQAPPSGFAAPNTTSNPTSDLVSFTATSATENSRRFSVSSLLELEDLTPGGVKRGQDADRSEGKARIHSLYINVTHLYCRYRRLYICSINLLDGIHCRKSFFTQRFRS